MLITSFEKSQQGLADSKVKEQGIVLPESNFSLSSVSVLFFGRLSSESRTL